MKFPKLIKLVFGLAGLALVLDCTRFCINERTRTEEEEQTHAKVVMDLGYFSARSFEEATSRGLKPGDTAYFINKKGERKQIIYGSPQNFDYMNRQGYKILSFQSNPVEKNN